MPTLKSITYKPQDREVPDNLVGYFRLPLIEANLIQGYGIEGDRKGGPPRRNLNVMDDVTLAELEAEGYPVEPGKLGENLIISGMDLRTHPHGTQVRIGDEAIVELRKLREPCEQLTAIDARMPEGVVDRVGVMCRVLRSGKIKVGDEVEVVTEKLSLEA
jgi:MOSC domain-containing protein YiiM